MGTRTLPVPEVLKRGRPHRSASPAPVPAPAPAPAPASGGGPAVRSPSAADPGTVDCGRGGPGIGDAPEIAYVAEADPARRRRFAQFFTPFPLAAFMARWVLDGPRAESLLDPALGLGVFARAVAAASPHAHRLSGYEIDPLLADRAEAVLAGLPERLGVRVERADFLASDWEARWDGVLCNPPYLRFQEYAGRGARLKALEDRMGVRLGGLTNLHGLFLLKAVHQLAEDGRAAFILPWEFLNAGYGERIKAYLLDAGVLRHAVVFDSARGVFAGAVTTACILLLGRDGKAGDVAFHRAGPDGDLSALYRAHIGAKGCPPAAASRAGQASGSDAPGPVPPRIVPSADLDPSAKWKGYWQGTSQAIYRGLIPLETFATVLRGIATGCNEFFVLDEPGRLRAGLPESGLLPCVAKARDAEGPVFGASDLQAPRERGRKAWLLDAVGREGDPAVAAYLRAGLRAGAHRRFLTRHRSPWYALENRPPAPLWVSVFNRGGGLKPVLNRAGVRNLTAFHCLYPKPGAEPYLEALFAWLLTAAGRAGVRATAREYGAGLEKIEPKDLAGARVPDFTRLGREDLDALRELVTGLEARGREGGASEAAQRMEAAFGIFKPCL